MPLWWVLYDLQALYSVKLEAKVGHYFVMPKIFSIALLIVWLVLVLFVVGLFVVVGAVITIGYHENPHLCIRVGT